MKKYVLMSVMALALAMPGLAWSQSAPLSGERTGPSTAGPSGAQQGGVPQQGEGESSRFAEHKAEVLRHMNEHLADVQKRINCVEAATNHEQLHACMPQGGRHAENGGGRMNGPHGGQPEQSEQ